jgi:hypothetical protein
LQKKKPTWRRFFLVVGKRLSFSKMDFTKFRLALKLRVQVRLTKIHTRNPLLFPLRGVGWRGYLVMQQMVTNTVW